MRSLKVKETSGCRGWVFLPGDKSIAHRCIILSALSQATTKIDNFPANKDCLSTLKAFQSLGTNIKLIPMGRDSASVILCGKGLRGLKQPKKPIFVGESGTTLRLLLGVLAGQKFKVKLVAGKSLSHRPMLRVTAPLRMMGAKISAHCTPPACPVGRHTAHRTEEYPPITVKGGNLRAITYKMPVASAQVKSALLLAGLYAKGITRIIEPIKTRDHTERLLKLFRADLKIKKNTIFLKGGRNLISPQKIYVPSDISSASFFIVLAAILSNSRLLIKNVSLNPSRLGIVRVLKRMGARISIKHTTHDTRHTTDYEPMGDILVKTSRLKGTIVIKEEIPALIDELPILMVAASLARGQTVLEGVQELRVKETDRIRSMAENLKKMGARISVKSTNGSESIIIQGVKGLRGEKVKSFSDHRTAMAMIVAGLVAKGKTSIDDVVCINKSFPGFLNLLKKLELL